MISFLARSLLWLWRPVSVTLFGSRCRFTPSCSEYFVSAMEIHGFWRGLFLGVARLAKCHPGNCGGEDPVPARTKARTSLMDSTLHG